MPRLDGQREKQRERERTVYFVSAATDSANLQFHKLIEGALEIVVSHLEFSRIFGGKFFFFFFIFLEISGKSVCAVECEIRDFYEYFGRNFLVSRNLI